MSDYIAKVNDIEVKGNPFDVIMHLGFSFLHQCLSYSVMVYKRKEADVNNESGMYILKNIEDAEKILSTMTKDQIETCWDSSILKKSCNNLDMFIDFLWRVENMFPTSWSEKEPECCAFLEKFLYGDSPDFYRREKLIKMVESYFCNKDAPHFTKEEELYRYENFLLMLKDCEEIINYQGEIKPGSEEENYYYYAIKLMKDYEIEKNEKGEAEINFLKSVVNHRFMDEFELRKSLFDCMRMNNGLHDLLDHPANICKNT